MKEPIRWWALSVIMQKHMFIGKKIKMLAGLLISGIFLIVFSGTITDFALERIFIAKYGDAKDFWPVYGTIKENRELIEKNPGNDSAYYSLGQGYYGLRAYNEAIKALKRATEIKPDNFDYRSFLGKVYQAKKDYPAARDAYIETLRLNPDKQNHYIQLAWLYYFRLDPEKDKAFEVLRRGIEKFPTDRDLLFDITRYYLYDQNKEGFFEFAPRYLKVDPDNELIKTRYNNWEAFVAPPPQPESQ